MEINLEDIDFNNLTLNEKLLIKWCRERKPGERIEIIKDRNGKADSFLVQREHRILLVSRKGGQY